MAGKVVVRPISVVLVAVALGCVVLGIVYFMAPAKDLPGFMPGHSASSTHHHVKHGLAMLGLAVVALIGAWMTTAPGRSRA